MCRSIKTLFNFEPPASDEELRAASLQFVRKLSGFHTPSRANQPAFDSAVEQVFLGVAKAGRRACDELPDPRPRGRGGAREGARATPCWRDGALLTSAPGCGGAPSFC